MTTPDPGRSLQCGVCSELAPDCRCGHGPYGAPDKTRESVVRLANKSEGDPYFKEILDEMWNVHLLKSGGYGTGADPFENFTVVGKVSGEPRHRYARRRMLEKLVRLESLDAQGRDDELDEEYRDIMGLAGCALAMRRRDREADPNETDSVYPIVR